MVYNTLRTCSVQPTVGIRMLPILLGLYRTSKNPLLRGLIKTPHSSNGSTNSGYLTRIEKHHLVLNRLSIVPFIQDNPMCDGRNCSDRSSCARWIVNCDIAKCTRWPILSNRKPFPDRCPLWLKIPNENYPQKKQPT